jgi:uncharacterized iron-regulated membrane protein
MKALVTRWLVFAHRWLAIGTCLLFVIWFMSGLVLMYVDFPNLTARERTARLAGIDWQRVLVTPAQALRLPEVTEFPRELRLEMMGEEPVYRIEPGDAPPITVSALTGRVVSGVSAEQARDIAAPSMRPARPVTVRTVTRDQWTVSSGFNVHRPLHVVRFDDDAATDLYVSSRDGDIVLDTTARERGWNWIGAVIHWIYFSDLRTHPAAWRQVVLWLSGIGIVVAISGLWLGIDRLRLRRRTRGASITPFRGWQGWHHIAGVIGGIFLLTWIFSGWLSMDPPGPWSSDPDMARIRAGIAAYRGHDAPDFEASLDVLHSLAARDVRTASFSWLGGRPLIVLGENDGRQRVVAGESGASVELKTDDVFAAARSLVPDAHISDSVVLREPDAYWYSHREERSLPVLRIIYDDAQRTWIYLDPASSVVLARIDASGRLHRWLFNALHSFDVHWLLAQRPLRDAVMWLLSIAGLAVSLSGVVLGVRRLRRA